MDEMVRTLIIIIDKYKIKLGFHTIPASIALHIIITKFPRSPVKKHTPIDKIAIIKEKKLE